MEPEKALLILHDMLAVLPGLALDCAQSMETDGLTHPIIATLVDAIAQSAAQCSRRLATIA